MEGNRKGKGRVHQQYDANEGIPLDPQNMRYNPGLRQVAKILLNYWGKFGQ